MQRFMVHDVPEKSLSGWNASQAIADIWAEPVARPSRGILGGAGAVGLEVSGSLVSASDTLILPGSYKSPFMNAFSLAWTNHIKLSLTPDAVWLAIFERYGSAH